MSKRLSFVIFAVIFWGSMVEAASKWSWTGFTDICHGGMQCAMLTDGRILMITGYIGGMDCEIFDPAIGEWKVISSARSGTHRMALLLPNGQVAYFSNTTYRMYKYNPMTETWDTTVTPFSSWQERASATLLRDGRALLMYSSRNCYLYDCWGNSFTPAAPMNELHTQGIEVLLPDGKVMAAGAPGSTPGEDMSELYDPVSDNWTITTGQLHRVYSLCVGALLPGRNKVIIVGGSSSQGHTELYDIGTQLWDDNVGILNLITRRCTPTMVILPNGKPMIMGGAATGGPDPNNRCEIYDIDANVWTYTDSMVVPRGHHTSGVLVTGKVISFGNTDDTPSSFPMNSAEIYDPSNPTWELKANLITARKCHTVTILPIYHTTNCSTNVLVAGGEDASGTALKSCELFNYGENEVTATGDLNVARTHHCALLFPPPAMQVIAIGGKNASGATNSCEIYDVVNESWAPTGSMGTARFDHTATLLANGDILVTGGEGSGGTILNSGEVYSAGSWTPTTNMTTARTEHNAVILLDGRVMVIGGRNTGGTTNSTEIWNGTTWSAGPSLNTGRYLHTAMVLQSGKVLVIGGRNGGGAIASCEIWNPAGGGWQYEGNLLAARYAHNSTLLYSGMILTSGGTNGTNYAGTCEIWDPAAERDTLTNRHNWKQSEWYNPRGYHASVLVPIVKPYIISIGGGTDGGGVINNIERWDVGLEYQREWQSEINSHPSVTPISSPMMVQGTLFRGVSEADGGNYCHIASTDHPVMTLLRVGGGNYQGNGGGDILYMPLSDNWNETQTNIYPPATAPAGYYRMWAVVNGIPTKWYNLCADVEENSKQGSFVPSVFPSPSMGSVMFRMGNMSGSVTIKVYDCTGRIMRIITNNMGKEVKLSNLKAGIYFYKVEAMLPKTGAVTHSGKFIVL